MHVATDAERQALTQWFLNPPKDRLGGMIGQRLMMTDEERESEAADIEEMRRQSAQWKCEYGEALADLGS